MNAKLKTVEHAPADTLREAGARLKAAQEAAEAAEARIAAFDTTAAQEAEDTAQERVRVADEALADALADDDAEAITAARERRAEAITAWNTARGQTNDRRSALRALERRRGAAEAEQEAAEAAMRDALAEYLRGELETAEKAYAKAAADTREAYCRTLAVFERLKVAMGREGRGRTLGDTTIRLPSLGQCSQQLREHPEQRGPVYDSEMGSGRVGTAAEALNGELETIAGGDA